MTRRLVHTGFGPRCRIRPRRAARHRTRCPSGNHGASGAPTSLPTPPCWRRRQIRNGGQPGLAPHEHAPVKRYSDEFSRRTYRALGRETTEAIRLEGGALVDATFRRRRDREAFREGLGTDLEVGFFAECRAPAAGLLQRAEARARREDSLSDAAPASWRHSSKSSIRSTRLTLDGTSRFAQTAHSWRSWTISTPCSTSACDRSVLPHGADANGG